MTSKAPTLCEECKTSRALYRALNSVRRLCGPCARQDAAR